MTVREYIGARYVPLFMGEWDNSNAYEPLSIVTYQGDSYTSRQSVPIGIAITNTDYWAVTGNYNAQVEAYRQEVRNLAGIIPDTDFSSSNTVKDYVDGTIGTIGDDVALLQTAVGNLSDIIPATDFDNVNTVKTYIDNGLASAISTSEANAQNIVNNYLGNKFVNVLNPPDAEDTPLVADWVDSTNFTDNGPLFQALLDKYGTKTTYYFPIGYYGFATSVNIANHYISIVATNPFATRLYFYPETDATLFNYEVAENSDISDCSITNVSVYDAKMTINNTFLSITNPTRLVVTNVFSFGFRYHYYFKSYQNSGSGIIFYNCLVHHYNRSTSWYGYYFSQITTRAQISDIFINTCWASLHGNGTWIYGKARDINIINCETREGVYGVYLIAPDGVTTAGGVKILNCVFDDYAGTSIWLEGFNKEIMIKDCWGDTQTFIETIPTYFYGIVLSSCSGAIVSGNHWGITDNTLASNYYHDNFCRMSGNCSNITIVDNIVWTPSIFVQFITASGNFANHVIISGNTVISNEKSDVGINNAAIILGDATNVIISNNIITKGIMNSTSVKNIHGSGNMYKTTINSPLSASDNYQLA